MRVPHWVVPALVLLCASLGVAGARVFAVPSVVLELAPGSGTALRTAVFVVDGVKCVDTAERAAEQLEGVPGALRFVAYASRNRAEITFDPSLTDVAALRDAIEAPVYDAVTGSYLFGVYTVVEVDGVEVGGG